MFHHREGDLGDLKVEKAEAGYDYVPGWGRVGGGITERFGDLTQDLYDGEVRYTDDGIARILERLDALGILDDTVIIIMGDHGEDMCQHAFWGHGTLHETTVRVPLILKNKKPVGKRI